MFFLIFGSNFRDGYGFDVTYKTEEE